MARRRGSKVGQSARELDHVIELLLVPPQPPHVVVAVLAPAPGVDADGLDVAAVVGADPHVLPRRRDGQGADAGQHVEVADAPAVDVEVDESLAAPPAAEARP